MVVRKIIRLGDASLYKEATPVDDISSVETKQAIQDMLDSMKAVNGIGLAAPQIGIDLRIVIISFKSSPRYPNAKPIPQEILMNPIVKPLTKAKTPGWEGCLSVPGLRGIVERYDEIEYSALNENGNEIKAQASGMKARMLQHETDHLNGIVFPMRIKNMRWIGFEEEVWPLVQKGEIPKEYSE